MRREGSRGQSLVEFAVLIPLLLLLFAGVWTAADLLANTNTAGQASRTGARLAAQVGNNGYRATSGTMVACQTSPQDPCEVDRAVVLAMRPILLRLTNATVQEIDIYRPVPCAAGTTFPQCPVDDGSYRAGNPIDRYGPDGSPVGPAQYSLDLRAQTHPNEASIGVLVRMHYRSPTLPLFSKDTTEYTVIRLAPQFS